MTHQPLEFNCSACQAKNRLPQKQLLNLIKSPRCGKCEEPLLRNFNKPFKQLDASAYIHPIDLEATAKLKHLPGVDTILRALVKQSYELAFRIHHEANYIRVGKRQLPQLYKQFEHACDCLGVGHIPELYVYQSSDPNAYTFGVDKSIVAISSGALEAFDDDEILCALSHELGHVHADHVLYKTASRLLAYAASSGTQAVFGIGGIVLYPIQLALARWDQASELSADRAALLVVKNPNILIRTLMKTAGGGISKNVSLNVDAFIEQAETCEEMKDEGLLGKYLAFFNNRFSSHPYPIWRAKEIISWATKGEYLNILDGRYGNQTNKPTSAPADVFADSVKGMQNWYKRNFEE